MCKAPGFRQCHFESAFFAALQQKGYVETFVYWACQRGPVPGVRDWIKTNDGRVREFRQWAAQYPWPAPTASARS